MALDFLNDVNNFKIMDTIVLDITIHFNKNSGLSIFFNEHQKH